MTDADHHRHSPRLTLPIQMLVFHGGRCRSVPNADIFSSENVQDPVLPICDEAARVPALRERTATPHPYP